VVTAQRHTARPRTVSIMLPKSTRGRAISRTCSSRDSDSRRYVRSPGAGAVTAAMAACRHHVRRAWRRDDHGAAAGCRHGVETARIRGVPRGRRGATWRRAFRCECGFCFIHATCSSHLIAWPQCTAQGRPARAWPAPGAARRAAAWPTHLGSKDSPCCWRPQRWQSCPGTPPAAQSPTGCAPAVARACGAHEEHERDLTPKQGRGIACAVQRHAPPRTQDPRQLCNCGRRGVAQDAQAECVHA
jgi:hypothetical protein